MKLNIILKRTLILLFILFSINLNAQSIVENTAGNSEVEMADQLRKDGKIYIVVAVVTTIMAGIVVYLVRLDSKITTLEKEIGVRRTVSK